MNKYEYLDSTGIPKEVLKQPLVSLTNRKRHLAIFHAYQLNTVGDLLYWNEISGKQISIAGWNGRSVNTLLNSAYSTLNLPSP